MKLSEHFTFEELTHTSSGLDNIPMKQEQIQLLLLVNNILEPLRQKWGKTININSGYRSPMVNRHIGGAANSQHVLGQAADITAGSPELNKELFEIAKTLPFDQLIWEKGYSEGPQWIHVSYGPRNRREILIFDGNTYRKL